MSSHFSESKMEEEYLICLKPDDVPPLHVDGDDEQLVLISISDPGIKAKGCIALILQLSDLIIRFTLIGGKLPEQSV